jgi:hypothetical protein
LLELLAFRVQALQEVENRFPHMTLMIGDWRAVQSNDLLESLDAESKQF